MPFSEHLETIFEITANTIQWSLSAVFISGLPALAFAWLLARKEFVGKGIISSLVSLPLVLPPTAVGFLLLGILAFDGPLGKGSLGFDLGILLSPGAVILACAVMSFPLIVRTARVAFESVDPRLESMAATLGYSRWMCFFKVTLPLARRGIAAALILGFTRCLGEFGASVIIAGNIPGQTQTLASAIYSAQQTGNDELARGLMLLAVVLGFIAVYLSEYLTRAKGGRR